MGGGLMQLVAYGTQDIYLTGNPQITFFKVVYRRHTNFAIEAIIQNLDGKFDFGRECSCTIARNGDLIHRVYVEVEYDGANSLAVNAFQLIDEVELEIGGQLIDRHYGEWMNVWTELTHSDSKWTQLERLTNSSGSKDYIPLQFSFCRNPGLALPLIALQYHEVKLNFRVAEADKVTAGGSTPVIKQACLYVDYLYLDTDERRRFAKSSHEYLIEQTQAILDNSITGGCMNRYKLHLNHPVKEFMWVHNLENSSDKFTYGEFTEKALIRLNGHDRMDVRPGDYYKNVQRYQHHTGAEKTDHPIYLYSFALDPEEHQPSGTCNFSRIDNAFLELTSTSGATGVVNIYGVNYNVLKVMSGMGGLAYSN